MSRNSHQKCQSLFFHKFAGLRPAALIKKGLRHSCFPVNFAKFSRTPILQKLLVATVQYFSKSSSFSTSQYGLKFLNVVRSDSFHGFLMMWLSLVDIYWNFREFLCSKWPTFHHIYWTCYETIMYNLMIIFKNATKSTFISSYLL